MDSVGLRELKNRLSEYVDRVKSGEALVVTDRGQAVAELRPIAGNNRALRMSLADLVRAHARLAWGTYIRPPIRSWAGV